MCLPHKWFSLVSHQSQSDLTGLSEETLGAHGPHGVDHVLGQTEGNHLRNVKCLPLVESVRKCAIVGLKKREKEHKNIK